MKKVFIIVILLFSSMPLWPIDSREMEEIIKSITGSNIDLKEKETIIKQYDRHFSKADVPGGSTPKRP